MEGVGTIIPTLFWRIVFTGVERCCACGHLIKGPYKCILALVVVDDGTHVYGSFMCAQCTAERDITPAIEMKPLDLTTIAYQFNQIIIQTGIHSEAQTRKEYFDVLMEHFLKREYTKMEADGATVNMCWECDAVRDETIVCAECHSARYCDEDCRKADLQRHAPSCAVIARAFITPKEKWIYPKK